MGANLIADASYAEAVETYEKLEQLVSRLPAEIFPRLEFPRSNAILARFRHGQISPAEAVWQQQQVVADVPIEGDPYYAHGALAAYLALNGDLSESLERFDSLVGRLHSSTEPEPSMVYLLESNRCVVRFLSGDSAGLETEWQRLRDVADSIAYVVRPELLARHDLLWSEMAQPHSGTPLEFDACLLDKRPPAIGRLWDNLCRSLRIPEVEFWREN